MPIYINHTFNQW